MRPQSIILFERLFLASIALSLVTLVVGFDAMKTALAAEPNVQRLGLGTGLLLGIVAVSYAVYLLLWFLIAHRASRVAKWILVVFVTIGVLSALPALGGPRNWALLASLAVYALEIAAVVCLFRADAVAWLARGSSPDAALD